MKLTELIEQLTETLEREGDHEVVMTADYGDYHHTIQALPITGIETEFTIKSAYSRSEQAIADRDEIIENEGNLPRVIALR